MSKVRVYEVARELGMKNKELVSFLQSLGFSEVRNHMSAVESEVVDRIRRKLERRSEPEVVEERINPTVVKRRGKADRIVRRGDVMEPSSPGAPKSMPMMEVPPSAPAPRVRRPAKAVKPAPVVEEAAPAPFDGPEGAPMSAPRASERGPSDGGLGALEQAESAEPRALDSAVFDSAVDAPPSVPAPPPSVPASSQAVPVAPPSVRAAPPSVRGEEAPRSAPSSRAPVSRPAPSSRAARPSPPPPPDDAPRRRTQPPKSGIEVWEGRPGVPMPQRPRAPTGPAARRTTYDPRANVAGGRPGYGYGGRPVPGRPMRPGFRRGPGGFQKQRRGPVEVSTKEMSEHKKVIKIEGETSLQMLASKMSLKATEVLMKLLGMGMTGVNINSTLDVDTAKLLAGEFGWVVEDVSINVDETLVQAMELDVTTEGEGEAVPRPPIVTVMGHVDHGKTSLLDKVRKSQVAAGEAGGITQHIGAYRVETKRGTVCFLDTPGHEAFTAMRARGASLTDIVILVVAADDGVMPQTKEAISHARAGKVPMIVAINKIDKPGIDLDRIMRSLATEGLQPEDWGGDTIFCKVSAKTGEGIDQLLEMILLQAELLELRAHPQKRATGVVVEALLDRGRGPVARVLVQDGTLQRGDILLAGSAYGKIRAMVDERGRSVKDAGPSTPVEVLGLNEVPDAGDPAHALKDIRAAETLADERRKKTIRPTAADGAKFTLDKLATALSEAEQLELKVIIKADVQGSVEALAQALGKLSTPKVKLTVVHTGVGGITETDVNLAVAARSIIVGFNVRPAGKARKVAEQEGVEIRLYTVIYEVLDDVKAAMEGLLPANKVEKELGKAEVRQVFRISKVGAVSGCLVIEGSIKRSAEVRLVRDSVVVWQGKIAGLKRFKDDAREVREGTECGIGLEGYNDVKEGDVIEAFEVEEVKATLD